MKRPYNPRVFTAVLITMAIGLLAGCGATSPSSVQAATPATPAAAIPELRPSTDAHVRVAGLIRAVRVYGIQTPQVAIVVQGGNNRLTLVTIIENGQRVNKGDTLAEFDDTRQQEETLEVKAKFEELGHQVEQKRAQNLADSEKRLSDLKQAMADLEKAQIQLKKGPVLADIVRKQNEIRAESAQARVESLKKSHAARSRAESAALRVLELQRDRQKIMLERSQANASKLVIKAPLSGMVALENVWKGGTMGQPREGDQLWPGQPLLKIFDPSEMFLDAQVGEPDGARLKPGAQVKVQLDAYPGLEFDGVYESGSPVATTAIGSPVKNFQARFRLLSTDPRLLPDLSAVAVLKEAPAK